MLKLDLQSVQCMNNATKQTAIPMKQAQINHLRIKENNFII